ncbi:uncharacterized protein DNG_02240 [Cephalotrichum gorgonifer]|uniref:Uncharacterized protein n=1 Tax=Cephalotrichum gorgonifer TaxID=2041049 RepID=A0AAE8MSN0_9PEZI|nr:uncharacterized protein DNG_02240 [Cephalotrichum gorgonifer]
MPSWQTGSACITVTVYDDPTNLGHPETPITCAGEVGLPEDAETLYRTLPDPSASSESSTSYATPIASPSSATPGPTIDANNGTAASTDDEADITDDGSCSPGAIAGLVVGCVIVAALLVAFVMARRMSHR